MFWGCVWDSGCQRTRVHFFGESHFCNASFLLGLLSKYDCLGKNNILGMCFGILDVSERIYTFAVNLSILLELLLKCDCFGKIIFWVCVWDSGFLERIYIFFVDSQLYNASLLLGLLLKYDH